MQDKNLIIINNEKVFKEGDDFYCDNLDLKVLPEDLNNFFHVRYIVRKSNKKGSQKINLKNIKIASNIFDFFYLIIQSIKVPNSRYLLISITPYTFLAFLILFLFRKKIFLYLFSRGQEEYKYILGGGFVWIYHVMYLLVTAGSKVLVNHDRLYDKKKSYLINSSRLDENWTKNHKIPTLDKVRFLYIGRINPEKGIIKFAEMLNKIEFDYDFSIVGDSKNINFPNKKIKHLGYIANQQNLIEVYDKHNITVLPSYTEASPYILDESLSRNRPIIIFEEIAYVVRNKIGVFVSKRDFDSFSKTVKYIMKNYLEIQKKMTKNILPTKKSMIKEIADIISA